MLVLFNQWSWYTLFFCIIYFPHCELKLTLFTNIWCFIFFCLLCSYYVLHVCPESADADTLIPSVVSGIDMWHWDFSVGSMLFWWEWVPFHLSGLVTARATGYKATLPLHISTLSSAHVSLLSSCLPWPQAAQGPSVSRTMSLEKLPPYKLPGLRDFLNSDRKRV
jgi:hypothetical protein